MKKILKFILVAFLLVAVASVGVFADEGATGVNTSEIKLNINGTIVDCEKYGEPVRRQTSTTEETVIPLLAFTDAIGASVKIDSVKNTASVEFGDDVVVFTMGKASFVKNGNKTYYTDIAPEYVNGVVMISTETLSVAFGARLLDTKSVAAITVEIPNKDDMPVSKPVTVGTQKKENDFWHEFTTVIDAMNNGFITTLKLFFVTLLGAIPLGLLICLCSISKIKPIKWITRLAVWVIRGTPLMLQLLIIYYIPGIAMNGNSPWPTGEEGRFFAASIAFVINYAFYFSEIYRGGIENIHNGQIEAGQVLGMTKTQIFFNVTLMQMVKRIVPPMSNEIITLVKDTSIARIISLQEVIWAGYSFLKGSHGYSGLLWPIFFTGVYYLAFNGILTLLFGYIEKKLNYYKG